MSSLKVEIHAYTMADVDDLCAAVRESIAEMSPWLQWCHAGYALDDSREFVTRSIEMFRSGEAYNFNIRDATGNILGGCGLNHIQPEHRLANLGYWVRTSQTGRGVATAAVGELAGFAFEKTDLCRLEIVCAVDNHVSQRVAEKSGALREGVVLDRLRCPGGQKDAVIYAILRSGRHVREVKP